MGTSYRLRIGLREIQAMEPNTILWDQEVRGFVARRQLSELITFSVVYRTKENVQRWQKLERFPILTPHLARQEAIKRASGQGDGSEDPAGEKMALRAGTDPYQSYATNIALATMARSREQYGVIIAGSNCTLSPSWGN